MRSRLGLDRLDAIDTITSRSGEVECCADGRTILVGIDRVDRPSPTPLTCKGRQGLAYPDWRITTFDEQSA